MDGGERQGMLRCKGGAQDKTIINNMMLRFRPIAPKPVNGQSFPCQLPSVNGKNLLVCNTNRRSKRKYVRVRKKNNGYKGKKRIVPSDHQGRVDDDSTPRENNVVTLQLLPEKTEPVIEQQHQQQPMLCNKISNLDDRTVEDNRVPHIGLMGFKNTGSVMGLSDQTVVESWVTVECVTGTCTEYYTREQLGSTDAERVRNLEADTCPGFFSDGLNRVQWVNTAYKRMVMRVRERIANGDRQSPERLVRVGLVVKEEYLPRLQLYGAFFTCWVRLQYTWQKEKHSQMLPCDVWRMDCGGFAWRLDVETALSLGR